MNYEESIMNYEEESMQFILTAYSLLRKYESQSSHKNGCGKVYLSKSLSKGYILRITDRGRLVLCKEYRLHTSTNYTSQHVISHSYNEKYSQITYVAKLLTVYLENLQKDEEENSKLNKTKE